MKKIKVLLSNEIGHDNLAKLQNLISQNYNNEFQVIVTTDTRFALDTIVVSDHSICNLEMSFQEMRGHLEKIQAEVREIVRNNS